MSASGERPGYTPNPLTRRQIIVISVILLAVVALPNIYYAPWGRWWR